MTDILLDTPELLEKIADLWDMQVLTGETDSLKILALKVSEGRETTYLASTLISTFGDPKSRRITNTGEMEIPEYDPIESELISAGYLQGGRVRSMLFRISADLMRNGRDAKIPILDLFSIMAALGIWHETHLIKFFSVSKHPLAEEKAVLGLIRLSVGKENGASIISLMEGRIPSTPKIRKILSDEQI